MVYMEKPAPFDLNEIFGYVYVEGQKDLVEKKILDAGYEVNPEFIEASEWDHHKVEQVWGIVDGYTYCPVFFRPYAQMIDNAIFDFVDHVVAFLGECLWVLCFVIGQPLGTGFFYCVGKFLDGFFFLLGYKVFFIPFCIFYALYMVYSTLWYALYYYAHVSSFPFFACGG